MNFAPYFQRIISQLNHPKQQMFLLHAIVSKNLVEEENKYKKNKGYTINLNLLKRLKYSVISQIIKYIKFLLLE